MPAIFDHCPACCTATTIDQADRGSVVAVYEKCRTCKGWHRLLLGAAIIAGLLTLYLTLSAYKQSGIVLVLNSAGVTLTIVGGYLIFGKLELLLLMGGTIGNFYHTPHAKVLARETFRARAGLLFVIAGLVFQGIR